MLTTTDAARQLGIPPLTLHKRRSRLAKKGITVGTVLFGGVVGWTPDDIARVQVLGKAGRPRKT